jgi:hypothetical protein
MLQSTRRSNARCSSRPHWSAHRRTEHAARALSGTPRPRPTAGHARTHPGNALVRWWPAARCQQTGAFAEPGDDVTAFAYTPRSRPDGHGISAEDGQQVPFFLEYDLGTERPLSRLVDKIHGYHDLADVTGRFWPVLFWLPSPLRERHLHQELAAAGSATR